jgi:hypothetical protein
MEKIRTTVLNESIRSILGHPKYPKQDVMCYLKVIITSPSPDSKPESGLVKEISLTTAMHASC